MSVLKSALEKIAVRVGISRACTNKLGVHDCVTVKSNHLHWFLAHKFIPTLANNDSQRDTIMEESLKKLC
jgi:nicotinate-nucleotide pyrophosphorylase